MNYFLALLLFLAITTGTWAVAIGLHKAFVGEPDPTKHPDFYTISAVAVGLVSLFCLIPYPAGYILALVIWWLTAKNFLELPTGRAVILFLLLAALSYMARLATLSALTQLDK